MLSEQTQQWFQILDLKNEIENLKLTISNIKISIGYSKNNNLQNTHAFLNNIISCDIPHYRRF